MVNLIGPKYEPLTPTEVAELWPIAKQGDEKARERLICSTLRSVVSECYRYTSKFDIDDLIGMAFVVATECFDSYDPKKGMQFYSYVVVSVRWKIGVELQKNHVEVYCTDDERMLEAFGGCTPTDPDTEHHREKRNAIIMEYLLSIPNITPEMIDHALKCKEGTEKAPSGLYTKLYAAARRAKPTPQILQAIEELMGADTAAKAMQAYEHATLQDKLLAERKERGRIIRERKAEREKIRAEREAEREEKKREREERHREYMRDFYRRPEQKELHKKYMREYFMRPEQKERQRERCREYQKRKREAARLAQPHVNDLLKQIDELKKENNKPVMHKPYNERKKKAVDNFNKLYEYIYTHTDAEPMQAEAAAYLTLKDYTTLKEWSDRHGLPYVSVKRWRMYVRKKLAALPHVDEDIRNLDPTLFKT